MREVEVRLQQWKMADALAKLRNWLDHNGVAPVNFDLCRAATGSLLVRIVFKNQDEGLTCPPEAVGASSRLVLVFEHQPEDRALASAVIPELVRLEPLRLQPFANGRHHAGNIRRLALDLERCTASRPLAGVQRKSAGRAKRRINMSKWSQRRMWAV